MAYKPNSMEWPAFNPETSMFSKCEIYLNEVPVEGIDIDHLRRGYPMTSEGVKLEVGVASLVVTFPRNMMRDAISERLQQIIEILRAEKLISGKVQDPKYDIKR